MFQYIHMVFNHKFYKGAYPLEYMQETTASLFEYVMAFIKNTKIITMKERDIIDYVFKNPQTSILKIARALGIDYKNAHRYVNTLIEKEILIDSLLDSSSENQKGKAKLISIHPEYKHLIETSFKDIKEQLDRKFFSATDGTNGQDEVG